MNSEAANLIQSLCMLAQSQQGLNLQQQCSLHRGAVQPDCLVSMPLCLPVHHATDQTCDVMLQLYAVAVPGQRLYVVGSASELVQQAVTFTLQVLYEHIATDMQWQRVEKQRSCCAGTASMLRLHNASWMGRRRGGRGGTNLASPSSRHCLPCFRLFLTMSTRRASALKAALPASSSIARLY